MIMYTNKHHCGTEVAEGAGIRFNSIEEEAIAVHSSSITRFRFMEWMEHYLC